MESKSIEIDNLPAGWAQVTVNDVSLRIHYGYTASATEQNTGVKYLRITDIQGNEVNWERVPYCEIDDSSIGKYLLKENDLVFARTGGTVGKSFLIRSNVPQSAVFASYLIRIILSSFIESKYVSFFFQSMDYWQQIQIGKTGLKTNVNAQILSRIKLSLPPLQGQHRIVEKIEAFFSELENGIEQLKTAQQQLKVYRQSVLKWAFEGKLTEKDVSDGELPKDWKWVKLGEVSKLITKGASPKWQGINYVDDPTQVLFVTSENVRENHLDISQPKYLEKKFNAKQKRSILERGDLLLNIVGASIGRAAIFELDVLANINQAVCVIRLGEDVNRKYVSCFLNSNYARSYYNLSKVDFARANLSLTDVSKMPLPLPPKEVQDKIVQEIETRLSVCDNLEETITGSLQQSEALRQSILKKAFEGRLVPQGLNEEPAEVLVARIRQERELFLKEEKTRKLESPKTIRLRAIMSELKSIYRLLQKSGKPMSSYQLWKASEHRGDIDAFYAKLKELLDKGVIKELPRKGKESFLTLSDVK
ncbi:MAG: restriction endonuclease subunit S [Bacteroidota bacterium]